MIDTNVIISAILKEGSVPDIVLNSACENYNLILCDHIVNECYEVAKKRFPAKISTLDRLFGELRYELVPSPRKGDVIINDIKDQPILNAAIKYDVDVLVTGDKHFSEVEIDRPEILKPAEFLERY